LLQLKVAQIFLHDRRHRHAQRRRKILHRHRLLLFLICDKPNQAPGQVIRASRLVKLNRQLLAVGHLAKILKISTHNRHAIRASQMRHAAASC
jgi:hypothetical protein